MKPVTIPSMYTPYLEVYINGAKRQFSAGQTITVEDDVASIIENAMKNVPARREPVPPIIPESGTPGQVLMKTEAGYAWADLLPATEDAIGGVIVGTGLSVTKNGTIKAVNATTSKRGTVFKGEAVAAATEDNVVDVVNALLESLEDAGVISGSASLTMTPPEEE